MEKRRSTKVLILVLAIALIGVGLCLLLGARTSKINRLLDRADEAAASGNYEQACTIYEQYYDSGDRAEQGFYKIAEAAWAEQNYDVMLRYYELYKSENEIQELYAKIANEMFEAERYESAAEYYELCNDSANEAKAWNANGDVLSAKGRYEPALESYKKADNEEKVHETLIALGNQYLQEQKWDDAKQIFADAGEDQMARDVLLQQSEKLIAEGDGSEVPQLLQGYTGSDVADLVFRALCTDSSALSESEKAKLAGEYGTSIRDTDTQLQYCKLLYENGYDLNAIYPDGVEVDYDLSHCDFWTNQEDMSMDGADVSNVAVFSWEDAMPSLQPYEQSSSLLGTYSLEEGKFVHDSDSPKVETLSVKLHPGMMLEAGQQILSSINAYSACVILKKGYTAYGSISCRTTWSRSSYYSAGTETKIYNYYGAYEAVYLCDPSSGKLYACYDGYCNEPIAANSIMGNVFDDLGITTDQAAEIKQALESEDNEESREILQKYDQRIIDGVRDSGDAWGDYIRFIYEDDKGNTAYLDGTSSNTSEWNTEKFMLGSSEDGWMEQKIEEGAVPMLILYGLLY